MGSVIFLMGLTVALRAARDLGAFDDLQESLLNTLAKRREGDTGVLRFAADLVDLVDIDDPRSRDIDSAFCGVGVDVPRLAGLSPPRSKVVASATAKGTSNTRARSLGQRVLPTPGRTR